MPVSAQLYDVRNIISLAEPCESSLLANPQHTAKIFDTFGVLD